MPSAGTRRSATVNVRSAKSEPDALSIFLVEQQSVVEYTLIDPRGSGYSSDLDGTYVCASGWMLMIGNGFFYFYDSTDWDEVTWMQDGYLVDFLSVENPIEAVIDEFIDAGMCFADFLKECIGGYGNRQPGIARID